MINIRIFHLKIFHCFCSILFSIFEQACFRNEHLKNIGLVNESTAPYKVRVLKGQTYNLGQIHISSYICRLDYSHIHTLSVITTTGVKYCVAAVKRLPLFYGPCPLHYENTPIQVY